MTTQATRVIETPMYRFIKTQKINGQRVDPEEPDTIPDVEEYVTVGSPTAPPVCRPARQYNKENLFQYPTARSLRRRAKVCWGATWSNATIAKAKQVLKNVLVENEYLDDGVKGRRAIAPSSRTSWRKSNKERRFP